MIYIGRRFADRILSSFSLFEIIFLDSLLHVLILLQAAQSKILVRLVLVTVIVQTKTDQELQT